MWTALQEVEIISVKSKFDVEARFRLGEVQLASSNATAARRTWQDLLAAHPESEDARIPEIPQPTALRRDEAKPVPNSLRLNE